MKNLKPLMISLIVALVLLAGMGISTKASLSNAVGDLSNDWTYTGNLNDIHWKGTATLLQNGEVLIAGGLTISGVTSSAELYNPVTGTWRPTGAMNTARELHTATLLPDGKVLVAGGQPLDQQSFNCAELFDPTTGTWSYTGSMKQARSSHTATLLPNGKVLVAGGGDGLGGYATNTELYDPVTGTWSNTGSLNFPRDCNSATLLENGKVLIAGGYQGYGINSSELYDPVSGTWSLTGSMNQERAWHTATLLPDGRVLVAGSEIYSNVISSAEIYDPATSTWSYTDSMNDARGNHTAVSLPDGRVLVAGGSGATIENSRSAEIYDPATGSWTFTGSMNDGRRWLNGTFLPNGKVLATGGQGVTTSELYNFAPSVFLIPSEQTLVGNHGDSLQYVEILSNYTGITDTFNLEIGVSPWLASSSAVTLGPLANTEQITFTVDVTIPIDADWGALNSLIITATSEISPTIYIDTAILNSRMIFQPQIYLPMVCQQFSSCRCFFDDFSDPNSGWYIGEDDEGRVEYLNGEYSVLVKPKDYYWILSSPARDQEDYSVEVDARWAGNTGASYGLIFGLQGDFERFYSFEVNTDYQDFTLFRYDAFGWTQITPFLTSSAIFPGGETNHLKVTRNGVDITLEINGIFVGTWNDSTITGSSFTGLIVGSYSDLDNAEARFDNFKATWLESPANASAAYLESQIQQLPQTNLGVIGNSIKDRIQRQMLRR